MLRSYLKQVKSIISLTERVGRIVDPLNYYDVRLSARLAGIINSMAEEKAARKKK